MLGAIPSLYRIKMLLIFCFQKDFLGRSKSQMISEPSVDCA